MRYHTNLVKTVHDVDPIETQEWLESFESLIGQHGFDRARYIMDQLLQRAQRENVPLPSLVQTPYVNTIPVEAEPAYPGDEALEERIRRYIRWNAVVMVLKANIKDGLGGHLSTYASAATLYEVGFNHFFRGADAASSGGSLGDQIYFQGHASPGIYARAFAEQRLSESQLLNFRRDIVPGQGLSSYPHPMLMPNFWQFPTVSMGLGPIAAIYQARLNRYLLHRGMADTSQSRVWCYMGDGECDEPESLGALHLASRERLGNLTFVINCNLQRLDGPVRGNGKIIQELEAVFHGAGWRVIKVVWGREWDPLFAADHEHLLPKKMMDTVDGQYQKYSVETGAYIRENFFGPEDGLRKLVEHMSEADLKRLRRGGHDMRKVYAGYQAAIEEVDRPTVILAKTVKGWALGEGTQGRNITHQQKKLTRDELIAYRDRLDLDIPNSKLDDPPFVHFSEKSEEREYLLARRVALGGFVPVRKQVSVPKTVFKLDQFKRYTAGSGEQDVSTTAAFSRMLAVVLSDKEIGKLVVPIIPDEARTFGLDALFNKYGIYSSVGQLYEPVDAHLLLSYREAIDGQVLEEGICEAGSIASFIAAGSAYSTFGLPLIPVYIFYSMFGFQRTGDQIWAAGDQKCRGFLVGATAGRTTLSGEGLQHCDGHSLLLASAFPHVVSYDPAFAYEIAVIFREGLRRMCEDQDSVIFYLTVENEPYPMPPMPKGVEQGILDGLYLYRSSDQLSAIKSKDSGKKTSPAKKSNKKSNKKAPKRKTNSEIDIQLFGSGAILNEVLRAQEILMDQFGVSSSVWSATSYGELRRDALDCEQYNVLNPTKKARVPKVTQILSDAGDGPFIAASDYMQAVPDQISRWIPGKMRILGTDGFGRSGARADLRRFYDVDSESIVVSALYELVQWGAWNKKDLEIAIKTLGIDNRKYNAARMVPDYIDA